MILETAKVCTKCKVEKPFTEFTRRKKMYKGVETWGYKSQCKPCHTEAGRVARQANLEKARAREKELREQRKLNMTPEQKEELRLKFVAWNKAWRTANPDRVKATKLRRRDKELVYKRNRYQLKIDELRAKCHKYYLANKEEINERHQRHYQKPEVKERLRAYQQSVRPQARIKARMKIRNLDPNYIKLLIRRNIGLPAHLVSKSLIETQRLIVQIKREVRK
jgi:hypothetical protein